MGNCQAVDLAAAAAAAAVIQHADGRVEMANGSLSAGDVMATNPGHYVAAIITVDHPEGKAVRYLNLLGPGDALQVGHLYRLVSFEDVLREFGAKRRVRLSKLLKRKKEEIRRQCGGEADGGSSSSSTEGGHFSNGSSNGNRSCVGVARQAQWRPTLQTIAEASSLK